MEIEAVNMEETISEGSVSQSVACTGTGKEAASVVAWLRRSEVSALVEGQLFNIVRDFGSRYSYKSLLLLSIGPALRPRERVLSM